MYVAYSRGFLHNTLAHSQCIHNGSQSVLYDPTVVKGVVYKGSPCVQNVETITNTTPFLFVPLTIYASAVLQYLKRLYPCHLMDHHGYFPRHWVRDFGICSRFYCRSGRRGSRNVNSRSLLSRTNNCRNRLHYTY